MKKIIFFISILAVVNFVIGFISFKPQHVKFSLQEADAAWFESDESSKVFEYDIYKGTCSVYAYVLFEYGSKIGVSLEPPSINLEQGIKIEYQLVAGTQEHCKNGKKFQDCSDAIGVINSILGDGDCVPNK